MIPISRRVAGGIESRVGFRIPWRLGRLFFAEGLEVLGDELGEVLVEIFVYI